MEITAGETYAGFNKTGRGFFFRNSIDQKKKARIAALTCGLQFSGA